MSANSKEFKELQQAYYAKLKFEGFDDIENDKGDLVQFENSESFSKRIGFKTEFIDSIMEYYNWAIEKALWANFKSQVDADIWSLHAEGQSSRDISRRMDCDQTWICRKIKMIRSYLR